MTREQAIRAIQAELDNYKGRDCHIPTFSVDVLILLGLFKPDKEGEPT